MTGIPGFIEHFDDRGAVAPRPVILIDDAPILGGAEILGLRLATWMLRERAGVLRPEVVCPGDSTLAARCRDASVPVIPISFPDLAPRGVPRMPATVRALSAVLRRAGRDGALVVATTARAQAYAAMAGPITRGAAPVVNLLLEQETAARTSARFVLRRTGRLVAIGENTAAAYAAAVPGIPIGRLNNVLDPRTFRAARPTRQARSADEPPTLGMLGRLIAAKGALELIEELALVPDAWARLTVVGDAQDAEYTARVRERIDELGLRERVTLTGFVSEIEDFLDEIDVLVVPSTGTEGQPTVIVEGLARGLPVVVRAPIWSPDFAGLPVIPYANAEALAAALEESREVLAAPVEELERRFGPEQAMTALIAAGS